jgi:DNA-binding PadR family transcriptional regulator
MDFAATRPPTARELLLLRLLVPGERYGRELRIEYVRATGEPLPLGSLYVTLARMEDKGLIGGRMGEDTHERGGNRRKYYRLTAEGMRHLDKWCLATSGLRMLAFR